MLDKNILKQYEEIQEKIEFEANKLLTEINELKPISGFSYLTFEKFEDGYIEYSGEEFWQYGGYEKHEYSLPMELLLNEEYRKEYIYNLEEELDQRHSMEEKRKREEAIKSLQKKKAKYEELKKEFEGKA